MSAHVAQIRMRPALLIVDDDMCIREALRDIAADRGWRVACASNGADALSALERATELPDVIVLDVMMPVMDGYEFRTRQRTHPRFGHVPVLVVTAHDECLDVSEQLRAPVLVKPFDIEAFEVALDALVTAPSSNAPQDGLWDLQLDSPAPRAAT